jgi:hypothetical protein
MIEPMASTSQLSIAELDFHPVPPSERKSPGRVKSLPARLYIDRWAEHREAWEFLRSVQRFHGEGAKTIVRALLHYERTVIEPLEARGGRAGGDLPPELVAARLEFHPLGGRGRRIKHVSARLYIDRWAEHREAYEFIQRMQDLHGEGNKTIVRALLHYQRTVHEPLRGRKK